MKQKIISKDKELSFDLEELHEIANSLEQGKYTIINDANYDIFEYIYNYNGHNSVILFAKEEFKISYKDDDLYKLIQDGKKLGKDKVKKIDKNRKMTLGNISSILNSQAL